MPSEDICAACNRGTPRKARGKKQPVKVQWICCDSCQRRFHSVCMRISDSVMEKASDFHFECDSCSVRGRLIPKSPGTPAPSGEVSELKKIIEELSAEVAKLRTELETVRTTSKKQVDRLRNNIHSTIRSDATTTRLTTDLHEKLETIERGAQLANTCSRTVNSCRLAINKIPLKEGEQVSKLVEDVLTLLGCEEEKTSVTSCFRVPPKPSKWSDRSLTPTIVAVFNNNETRQRVLRRYFERHEEAKLCNLRNGPALDYRFTLNEILSINTFRIRNHALRLKQRGLARSVFVRNDSVSVLFPGQQRYTPISTIQQLQELTSSAAEDSSLFYDALSADVSASSRC